jgi:hypothetical protein
MAIYLRGEIASYETGNILFAVHVRTHSVTNSQHVYSDGWRSDSVVGTVASVDEVLSIPEFARTNGENQKKNLSRYHGGDSKPASLG